MKENRKKEIKIEKLKKEWKSFYKEKEKSQSIKKRMSAKNGGTQMESKDKRKQWKQQKREMNGSFAKLAKWCLLGHEIL